jgi:hypothetical protein
MNQTIRTAGETPEMPARTADTMSDAIALSSPNGHMSKRAKDAATARLGRALFARWVITYIIYPLKWKWFQVFLWRISKPIVLSVAWVFVLNWSRKLR